jgi:hypothetical protein
MSIFKLKCAGAALVVLTLLVASSQVTWAETIFIKCVAPEHPNSGGPTYAIDLTNHTVDGKPATITPLSINWSDSNQYGDVTYSIDRATGIYTTSTVYHMPSGDRHMPEYHCTCTQVSAPPTKF